MFRSSDMHSGCVNVYVNIREQCACACVYVCLSLYLSVSLCKCVCVCVQAFYRMRNGIRDRTVCILPVVLSYRNSYLFDFISVQSCCTNGMPYILRTHTESIWMRSSSFAIIPLRMKDNSRKITKTICERRERERKTRDTETNTHTSGATSLHIERPNEKIVWRLLLVAAAVS